jgi:MFS family permease
VTFPRSLRALNSRNYRLFFSGQSLSLIGNWMTVTTTAWLGYELSNSAFVLGLLGFVGMIPSLIFAPFTGLLGDRFDRKSLLVLLVVLAMLQSLTLAIITYTGVVTVPWLLVLGLVQGLINSVEFPTRQTFVVEMIDDRKDLPNAIGLNSGMFNLARLLGPSLAGLALIKLGPAACYGIDTLTYLPVIGCFLAMRPRPRPPFAGPPASPVERLRAGWHYAANTPAVRAPLILVATTAMFGFAGSMLAPVFARDVFGGNAGTLGFLFAAVGAGALVGAGLLSNLTAVDKLARWITRGGLFIALGLTALGLSPSLHWALASLAITGFGTVLSMAGSNTLIQAMVEDDKRSRIMGLFVMAISMGPIGSLLLGFIAEHLVGPRWTVVVCAALVTAAALRFRHVMKHLPTVA